MDILQVIILSVVQGFTEFLPISSSAHLILIPRLTDWQDQGLAFDVTVHLGSLIAVMHYFRNELRAIIWGGLLTFKCQLTEDGRLAWLIVLATLPACVIGLLFNDWIEDNLRSVLVIATTTIVFAVLLAIADRKRQQNTFSTIHWQQALFIGSMQALALIPGTSRSGITITAALFIGMHRVAAAKFSFLLAVPLIIAASVLKVGELVVSAPAVDWLLFGLGFALSAISAWLCIHFMITLINRIGVMPFVVYRLLLGFALLFFSTMA